MLKKFYDILLTIEHFNPYGLRSYDNNIKLKGIVNDKKIIISKTKSIDGSWYVQMVMSDNDSKFEDYKYIDHIKTNSEPSLFTILSDANHLIKNWTLSSNE
jgi:hypothetical protein